MNQTQRNNALKYLTPDNLYEQLKRFTAGMAVTKGSFEHIVEKCKLEDVEWNHMDQMHRLTIHNTYEKGVRIACGSHFALSLTQWKNWPFMITVTDVYVAKGLFYQSMTIAGIIFIHSIISLEQVGDSVKLTDEWYIASHKLLKFTHKILNKKLHKLNARLQDEDRPVRQGRFELRKKGYQFRTDVPDYLNSNVLGQNTIYPKPAEDACISLEDVGADPALKMAGGIEFIIKKDEKGTYLIWPSVCPHEGGPLASGKHCEAKIICPWHGLQFSAAQLSATSPTASRYGFEYRLDGDRVFVQQNNIADLRCRIAVENESIRV